jgi:hypothetical protein
MERETTLADVRTFETRGGNTRYVVRDSEGNEYTTFREQIGDKARQLAGKRARIKFHEQQRGEYRNVYLDGVEPAGDESGAGSESGGGPERDTDPEEAAWRTAVDAAPWLVGSKPQDEVPPDQLYEKLKPFKDRVAEDIKND